MSEVEYRKLSIIKFEADKKQLHYVIRLLLAIDQFCNVLLFNGSHNETISSSIGRLNKDNKANWIQRQICFILHYIESKHCEKSIGE